MHLRISIYLETKVLEIFWDIKKRSQPGFIAYSPDYRKDMVRGRDDSRGRPTLGVPLAWPLPVH